MCDGQAFLLVERETVRASEAAGEAHEHAHLGRGALRQKPHTPNAVLPRHCEIQHVLVGIEHQAVRRWHIIENAVELAVGAQTVHAAGRIMHASLTLVGEIEATV
jgi:hypothetical protein